MGGWPSYRDSFFPSPGSKQIDHVWNLKENDVALPKQKYTCFTACQYLVGVYTGTKFFFLRLSRQHCEADLERETRAMHGEQVLQAIKEIKNIK